MFSDFLTDRATRVLVTGSNGFIGAKVVESLLEQGFTQVRCFVRPSSRLGRLNAIISRFPPGSVEVVAGDLISPEDCARAADGVGIVYHLAAGFDKSFAGAFMNSALATRNLVAAFIARGTGGRFVNVSSFAVYSALTLRRGAVVDENSPLEDAPHERYDAYGFGKLKQEEIVREYGRTQGLRYVILRPGAVFGPGKPDLSGRIGIDTFGFFVKIGWHPLPLTFVDNCAEAIVLAGVKPRIDGEVFNVVDDSPLTSGQFFRAYKRRVGRRFSITIPYALAYALSGLWEGYARRSRGQLPPAFNRRRCTAEWKPLRFSNRKIREQLGWRPKVAMNDAMTAFLSQFPGPGR